MLNLKSSVDGFKVVLGGYVLNLVVFLTLCIAVRPPQYPTEERTNEAKWLYALLIAYHFIFFLIKLLIMGKAPKYFRDKIALIMICAISLLIYLCQKWLYQPGAARPVLTKKQEAFEKWLWIEVLLIYGQMFSATIYSICHSFKPSKYQFYSNETKYLGDPDFLTIYGVVVDFASLNTTPAFVIFCL